MRLHLTGIARRFQQQLGAPAKRVDFAEQGIAAHERQLKELRAELDEVRKQVALDKSTPPKPFVAPGFDRATGPTQVAVVATQMVGLQGVEDEWLPFFAELDFTPEDFDIRTLTPLPSKKFAITFNGGVAAAARKVQKVLSNLRRDGQWRQFKCAADGADPARLRLGPDKSPHQVRAEMFLRKMRGLLGDSFGQCRWFVDREWRVLKADYADALKVDANPGDEPPTVAWNDAGMLALQLGRSGLAACVRPLLEPPPPTTRCLWQAPRSISSTGEA